MKIQLNMENKLICGSNIQHPSDCIISSWIWASIWMDYQICHLFWIIILLWTLENDHSPEAPHWACSKNRQIVKGSLKNLGIRTLPYWGCRSLTDTALIGLLNWECIIDYFFIYWGSNKKTLVWFHVSV